MYDKPVLNVLELVVTTPGIHQRELAKRLDLSMTSVELALRKLDKLVKMRKRGNRHEYELDYRNEAAAEALATVSRARLERLPAKIQVAVNEFLNDLPEKPLVALLFGSYARNDATSRSDVDLLLVFQRIEESGRVEDVARRVTLRTNTQLSPIALSYKEFEEGFHDRRKAFYTGLRSAPIILAGAEWWRRLHANEA